MNSRWPTKPLGDVLEISRERIEPSEHLDSAFNYIGLENIEGHTGKLLPYSPTFGAEIKSTKNVFRRGSILFGKLRPNLNKVHFANTDGICSTDIFVLDAGKEIKASFAAHFLRSKPVLEFVSGVMAGANLPRLSQENLLGIPIPVPPLPEQERIVKLLDEADELRQLRAQADHRAESLIPALFHEMFGDPATNPKGWPIKPLGEVCSINPKLPTPETPALDTDVSFIPMAAVDEISGSIARPEIRKYKAVAKGYTSFRENDVLFAKITPCMENGKAAIARGLHGGLGFGSTEFHVIRPSAVLLPECLFGLIRRDSFRENARANFTGTAGQQRVPTDFLKNFPVPVPPLVLQKEFARRVTEIRELETRQATSRAQLDALFQSMLHRAFNGEL